MKRMVAVKRMLTPLSVIKIKAKKRFWPGRGTELHEAKVTVERNSRKVIGKVLTKEKEFVVKSLKKGEQLPNTSSSFGVQIQMHQNLLESCRQNKIKLNIVPTLRVVLSGGEQSLLRTKLDAMSITQLGREHPEQVRGYGKELGQLGKNLGLLGFAADVGAFAPVKGKDGLYHPMLIDFATVRKK